jgi:hypothetical protein
VSVVREDPHDIRVGDRVRDNDRRTTVKHATVTAVDDRYVFLDKQGLRLRVLVCRIFADGKDRATGYTVIEEVTP